MRRTLAVFAVLAVLTGCGGGGGGGGDSFTITKDMADVTYVYSGGPRWTQAAVFYSTDLQTVIGAAVGSGLRNQGFTGSVHGAAGFDVTLANDDLDEDGDATNNILWPATGTGRFENGGDRFVIQYAAHEIAFNGSQLDVQVEFDGTLQRTEPIANAAELVARMVGHVDGK